MEWQRELLGRQSIVWGGNALGVGRGDDWLRAGKLRSASCTAAAVSGGKRGPFKALRCPSVIEWWCVGLPLVEMMPERLCSVPSPSIAACQGCILPSWPGRWGTRSSPLAVLHAAHTFTPHAASCKRQPPRRRAAQRRDSSSSSSSLDPSSCSCLGPSDSSYEARSMSMSSSRVGISALPPPHPHAPHT